MSHYMITYWLVENRQRRGAVGPVAGRYNIVVQAKSMREALEKHAYPADCDCYRMEIVPVHDIIEEESDEQEDD